MSAGGRLVPGGIMCREVVERVTAYLDGALSRDERARMDNHLKACGACVEYVEQIRATSQLAAVAAVAAELRPDRDRLLRAFRRTRADR